MRSLLAFLFACFHAVLNASIAIGYVSITFLIVELIWNSRLSGEYMFLWGLSFASYTLPKLVEKAGEHFDAIFETMLGTREQCIIAAKDGNIFNFAGAYLERIKIGNARQKFYSRGLDEKGFMYREWDEDFTIVIFTFRSILLVSWGKTIAKWVTWWMPKAIQVDYKINWKDRQEDTFTLSALRRRDILDLMRYFEKFGANPQLRPLMEHNARINYRTEDLDALNLDV